MSYPQKLLGADEQVVLDMHQHWKVLIVPMLEMLAVLSLTGFLLAVVDDGRFRLAIAVFAAILLTLLVVIPFLRWRTTLFVVTNERVVMRSGILSRQGRDVPLSRVNDVSFEHSFLERILGCGTLMVESAGERGQVTLTDVPQVEQVQRTVYDLVGKASR